MINLSGNSCFSDANRKCNDNYLNDDGILQNVSLSNDCADCLKDQGSLICGDSTLSKPCDSIVKAKIRAINSLNKNNADQYNEVVNTYNLFNDVLDTQSKLATQRWDKTRSTIGHMDETANNIMTKSRIIQLAEEEYERSKISMNRLLWFFISLIIIAVLIFAHSYKQISSTVLLYSVLVISVIYLTYYFLSGRYQNLKYAVDALEKKTEEVLQQSKEEIEKANLLQSLKEKAREMVGLKCGTCPSSAPSQSSSVSFTPIAAFQNEADLYFDGTAPVQQIYPRIQDAANGDRVHFNTQPDYGQRDSCNNTSNPKWLPSGLPKMNSANSVPTGVEAPMCNQSITTQPPSDVIIQSESQCSGPNYSVSSNFGGASTLISA